jgi:hypothetical protein
LSRLISCVGPAVNAVITVKRKPGEPSRQILASDAQLSRENQEITVFRFRIDGDGQLQRDSITSLYRPLRSGVKS